MKTDRWRERGDLRHRGGSQWGTLAAGAHWDGLSLETVLIALEAFGGGGHC